MKRVFCAAVILFASVVAAYAQNDTTAVVADSAEVEQSHTRQDIREAAQAVNQMRAEVRASEKAKRMAILQEPPRYRHEIKAGWGDQLFEQLIWHTNALPIGLTDHEINYDGNYRMTQHEFVQYSYNVSKYVSVGGKFDFSGVLWDNITLDGDGNELSRIKNNHFYNIIFMTTLRFNYFVKKYVNFYSGIGIGLDINTGTEPDLDGKLTCVAPAVDFEVFGVKAQYNNFFIAADLGGIIALKGMNDIYQFNSSCISVSVGANF